MASLFSQIVVKLIRNKQYNYPYIKLRGESLSHSNNSHSRNQRFGLFSTMKIKYYHMNLVYLNSISYKW